MTFTGDYGKPERQQRVSYAVYNEGESWLNKNRKTFENLSETGKYAKKWVGVRRKVN